MHFIRNKNFPIFSDFSIKFYSFKYNHVQYRMLQMNVSHKDSLIQCSKLCLNFKILYISAQLLNLFENMLKNDYFLTYSSKL